MKWYYVQDGQRRGPVFTSELAELSATEQIGGSTLVWREGLSQWTPLEALRDELPGSRPAEPEPENPPETEDDSPYRTPRSGLPEAQAMQPDRGAPAVFRHAGTMFYQRFWVLMVAYLMVWIPLNLLLEYAGQQFGGGNNPWLELRLLLLADAMIGIIAAGSVYAVCDATWRGDSPGLGWAIAQGLANYGRLFLTRFLAWCCILAGFILFVAPGVWMMVRLALLDSVVVSEKLQGTEALRRGWELTRDQFWPILGYLLLGLMAWFMGMVLVVAAAMNLPQDNWMVTAAVECAGAVPQVFLTVFVFVVYKHRLAVYEVTAREGDTHPVG